VVVYRHDALRSLPTALQAISLFLDIGQGAGLAGATGVRPFLPPLLAGVFARGDVGVDFEGTGYAFLETPAFLAAVLALAVVAYAAGRARRGEEPPSEQDAGAAQAAAGRGGRASATDSVGLALALAGGALGALLFAGSLADGGYAGWLGLVAGAACAALGYASGAALFGRARRRLDASAAALLPVWADAAALVLAASAILFPPLGVLSLVGFAWIAIAMRRERSRKFEGLRILR